MDKDEDSNIHKARDRSASAGGTACPEVDGRDSAIRVLDSHGSSKRQAADLAYRHRRKCAQQGYVVVVIFLRHARHNSQTTLRTHGKQGWSWHPYRMPVPVLRFVVGGAGIGGAALFLYRLNWHQSVVGEKSPFHQQCGRECKRLFTSTWLWLPKTPHFLRESIHVQDSSHPLCFDNDLRKNVGG